tara:strand:- start:4597 stop:5985 length:1389 start_codon:yes stop_codon:yes gene_type:complete
MSLFRTKDHFKELKPILRLGWPIILGQLCIMATGFLDTLMAGRYSATDLAGVALGSNLIWPFYLLLAGSSMALTPMVSQLRGGNKTEEVGQQVWQSLWLAVIAAVLLLVILNNMKPFFLLMGVDKEVTRIAIEYLGAVSWGIPALVFYTAFRHACEGLGHTIPPMLIAASIIPINALLNYGFIYGHFGLTELGGVGCGKATAIVWWLQLALMIVVINRPFFKITNFFNVNPRPRPVMAKQLFTIGQPIGLSVFLEMAIFSVISFLVAAISVQEVAANSIAFNLNWLTFVIPMSFGTAAGIRIGYHVGARELKLAGDAAAAAFQFCLVYALVVSILIIFWRYELVGLYTQDKEVIKIAAYLMMFLALYQIVDDAQAVALGCLRGYKDTFVPMIFGLIGYWLIALPVGHYLANGPYEILNGAAGYWTGMAFGLACVAVCATIRLSRITDNFEKVILLSTHQKKW